MANDKKYDLSVLAKHREQLLLAEVAAWLHDDFKHTDKHIYNFIKGAPLPFGKQNTDDLIPIKTVTLFSDSLQLAEIRNRRKGGVVQEYLNRCHYTAHIEKEDGDGPQSYPAYISSPFGFEKQYIPGNLSKDLRNKIPWKLLGKTPFTQKERKYLLSEIKILFNRVGGDTRRPANEITLWEWSHTVGALYKSALAGALLGFKPNQNDLRWRLMSIRFDGLGFSVNVNHLADLKARQSLLKNILNKTQELLEIEFPFATEVYRDENGSILVVPGCDPGNCSNDILTLQAKGKTIHQFVEEKIRNIVGGELVPEIVIDEKPWWGQDPKRKGKDELPPICRHIFSFHSHPDPKWVNQHWKVEHINDVCTVCGLRPQGPGNKAQERNVCGICEKRRADRAKEWTSNLERRAATIWTDEVADTNGRLALLTGSFELNHWLSGKLVRTLMVREPIGDHTPDKVSKNPSFARLRRIWETTRKFWEEVAPSEEADASSQKKTLVEEVLALGSLRNKRLKVGGIKEQLNLGPYHSYELIIKGRGVPVLWVPEEKGNGYFVTTINLAWLAKELFDKEIGEGEAVVKQFSDILSNTRAVPIRTPGGYGEAQREVGRLGGTETVTLVESDYLPVVPILSEPSTFMLLLPADSAVKLVEKVRTKYEREMGKVRNRLPLHLTLIFAHKRMPLRALFDAGRQALLRKGNAQLPWKVDSFGSRTNLPNRFNGDNHFAESKSIVLERDGRKVVWHLPLKMGDGQTDDKWYPYAFLAEKNEPSNRTLWVTAENPWNAEHKYAVHVQELRQGDEIYFTPSTFDFEFLDVTSRRFEVHYNEDGARMGLPRRPYMMDDLDDWQMMEAHLGHLEKHQVYQIVQTIEATRELWGVGYPENVEANKVFSQFVEDSLANAAWPKHHEWQAIPDKDREMLVSAGVTGLFKDLVELYFQILRTRFSIKTQK